MSTKVHKAFGNNHIEFHIKFCLNQAKASGKKFFTYNMSHSSFAQNLLHNKIYLTSLLYVNHK